MNGFIKKSVQTLTLGEKLKKLRSDKRISINEASRFTKIQSSYLEYLEDGNWEKLPADVYVKGFLRSYADFLGVDEKTLIRKYLREKEIKENLNKNNKNNSKKTKPVNISPFIFTPKKFLLLAIIILIFSGLFLLYKEIDSFANAPSLVIFNPQKDVQISDNFVYIEGLTDKDAFLFINGQSVLVGDDGRFREKLILQSGLNTVDIKSVNKFNKETVESLSIRSDYNNQENSENKETSKEENYLREIKIDLKVDPGPVWVKVVADGEIVFNGNILSGSLQSFKANSEIVIDSGKGNATFIKLNGQDFEALSSNPGVIKGVTFNLETKIENANKQVEE